MQQNEEIHRKPLIKVRMVNRSSNQDSSKINPSTEIPKIGPSTEVSKTKEKRSPTKKIPKSQLIKDDDISKKANTEENCKSLVISDFWNSDPVRNESEKEETKPYFSEDDGRFYFHFLIT